MVGTVPIRNISIAYTSRLRDATDATENKNSDYLSPLSSNYSEGDMVATAVVSFSKEGSRYSFMLSLVPNRVLDESVGELCRGGE